MGKSDEDEESTDAALPDKVKKKLLDGVTWARDAKLAKIILEDLPGLVGGDQPFQNAKQHSDRQNARIEHDKAVQRSVIKFVSIDTDFFKLYSDNESFRRMVNDQVFAIAYEQG